MRNAVAIAIIAGFISLGFVNTSILQKESLLNSGELVYLQLAPVDPRSLMQGDYMALRFQIESQILDALSTLRSPENRSGEGFDNQDGVIVVSLDEKRIARFSRIGAGEGLSATEKVMQYRVRNGEVKFATNAFFFQEGTASAYEQARYGEFRVGKKGELLLTGLRDKELNKLDANTSNN